MVHFLVCYRTWTLFADNIVRSIPERHKKNTV